MRLGKYPEGSGKLEKIQIEIEDFHSSGRREVLVCLILS